MTTIRPGKGATAGRLLRSRPVGPRAGCQAHDPFESGARPGHLLLLFQPVVGGVPHYVATLAEELSSRGWELSIAAPSDTPVLGRLRRVASRVVPFDSSSGASPRADVRTCQALSSLCRREGVDLIHAHSSKAGALAAVVGRMAGVKSIYSPHAWSFQRELSPRAERAYVTAERMLARRHAHVIAVADAEREAAAHYGVVEPERIALVHTGLGAAALPSFEQARRDLDIDKNAFVVGWVGRVGPQKRPEHLPVIAHELGEEAVLAVLGYGLPESAAGRALTVLGSTVVAATDPQTVYAASDALVVTSRW
jgi:glycosyltransferase involved in cell wall biosynthesis